MAPKKRRKKPLYEKSLPLPTKNKSQNRLFSRGTRQAPTLAAPLRAPMSECDYKIYNIYLTMHPIELFFKKKFLEEHTLESSSNEIEQQCISTVRTTTQAGCIRIPH